MMVSGSNLTPGANTEAPGLNVTCSTTPQGHVSSAHTLHRAHCAAPTGLGKC
jgi:hypothetical protein